MPTCPVGQEELLLEPVLRCCQCAGGGLQPGDSPRVFGLQGLVHTQRVLGLLVVELLAHSFIRDHLVGGEHFGEVSR